MPQIVQDYFQCVEADPAAKNAGETKIITGGWTPVNPTDPHVIEIGKFAVDAYNHKLDHHHKLIFVKVEKGWSQIVCGVNYKLIIAAKNKMEVDIPPPLPQLYEAVVFQHTSGKKELISFVPLLNQITP